MPYSLPEESGGRGHMDIKTLMMQDVSFLDFVARDENILANFDIFPPAKVLLSSFCCPDVLPFIH